MKKLLLGGALTAGLVFAFGKAAADEMHEPMPRPTQPPVFSAADECVAQWIDDTFSYFEPFLDMNGGSISMPYKAWPALKERCETETGTETRHYKEKRDLHVQQNGFSLRF